MQSRWICEGLSVKQVSVAVADRDMGGGVHPFPNGSMGGRSRGLCNADRIACCRPLSLCSPFVLRRFRIYVCPFIRKTWVGWFVETKVQVAVCPNGDMGGGRDCALYSCSPIFSSRYTNADGRMQVAVDDVSVGGCPFLVCTSLDRLVCFDSNSGLCGKAYLACGFAGNCRLVDSCRFVGGMGTYSRGDNIFPRRSNDGEHESCQ